MLAITSHTSRTSHPKSPKETGDRAGGQLNEKMDTQVQAPALNPLLTILTKGAGKPGHVKAWGKRALRGFRGACLL